MYHHYTTAATSLHHHCTIIDHFCAIMNRSSATALCAQGYYNQLIFYFAMPIVGLAAIWVWC